MYIEKLKLKNYRNYDELEIIFDNNINILYGNNAQGKTNILEAIYLVSTTKSQRGSKEKEIINFNSNNSLINIDLNKNNEIINIRYNLSRDKKREIFINENKLKKSKEILGLIKTVSFTPEDLDIVKNSPENRRKFIDIELCQIDKLYLDNLIKYNKILKERNLILKDNKYSHKINELLDIYDKRLNDYAVNIIKTRKEFISLINTQIKDIHNKITNNLEEIEIKYKPNTDEKEFINKLRESRDNDIRMRTTNVGPQRDDFDIYINNINIRKYGSQGQQRTAALSLKLSQINIIKDKTGDMPILLLDDVLSELDSTRQEYLLDSINDIQTFITCTGNNEFIKEHFLQYKMFNIDNGKIIS